jgi:hypothetical protein
LSEPAQSRCAPPNEPSFAELRYGCRARSKVVASALIVSLGAFMLNVVEAKPLHGLSVGGTILVLSLLAHGGLLLWDQYFQQRG